MGALWTLTYKVGSLLINGLPHSAPKIKTRPLRNPQEWRGIAVAKMAAKETGLNLADPTEHASGDHSNDEDKGPAAPGLSGRKI